MTLNSVNVSPRFTPRVYKTLSIVAEPVLPAGRRYLVATRAQTPGAAR
jgi:hypothetical protein